MEQVFRRDTCRVCQNSQLEFVSEDEYSWVIRFR